MSRSDPRLSVVLVVYNMRREAPRTLFSLSPGYQRGVDPHEYEVIVVENGSPEPLAPETVTAFGDNFRYVRFEEATPSPVHALNHGARQSHAPHLGLMIDGARIVSPGLLRLALQGLQAFRHPVVTTLGFHLGDKPQTEAVKDGYNQQQEDRLLEDSGWRSDGYRLFGISTLAGSAPRGWFQPVTETNCIFMPADLYAELGGFDERFVQPGGGLANLDFYRRACEHPDTDLLMLLGEGTFHQFHGGIMTNSARRQNNRQWREYAREYERLRGEPFRRPTRRPLLLGDVPAAALRWVKESCERYDG